MATPETLSLSDYMHGDEAIKIFDAYRGHPEIDDRTRVESIDVEFPWLAPLIGNRGLYLARFGDNKAGTFKIRGMSVGMETLLATHEAVGTYSAGNAGRSVAIMGKVHDIPTRVVVPRTAPEPKREGIRRLWPGGLLVVEEQGETYDEARQWALDHPNGYGELPPYDHPAVIAGQGTMVDDIAEMTGETDIDIVMTSGGAGGVAGTLKRLHERGMNATVHIVEAEGSNSLSKSMLAGEVVPADAPNRKYGGSAVSEVGAYALAVCQAFADKIIFHTAADKEVDAFIDLYEQHRENALLDSVPAYEPTSLVPMAKLAQIALMYPDRNIVAFGTGHNDALRPENAQQKTVTLSGTFPR